MMHTDKQKPVRTTIYLQQKLYDEIRKRNINLSEWVRENIEYELYQEKPEYVKRKIQELENTYSNQKNILMVKLKTAEQKQEKRKEKLLLQKPEFIRPGTFINKKEGGK